MNCQYCGVHFAGRPNQLYHSDDCKRQAEYDRERLKRCFARIAESQRAEREALKASLYDAVRYHRARQERDEIEISLLGFKLKLNGPPLNRYVEWLFRRKKPHRTFAEQAALDNHFAVKRRRTAPGCYRSYTPSPFKHFEDHEALENYLSNKEREG